MNRVEQELARQAPPGERRHRSVTCGHNTSLRSRWAAAVIAAFAIAFLTVLPAKVAADDASPAFLKDRSTVIRAAVNNVTPSIVTIETIGGAQPGRAASQPAGGGSFRVAEGPTTGVILSTDGYILTSSFNFIRNPTIITVVVCDSIVSAGESSRFVARLVARDQIRRLALLKIDRSGLPAADWNAAGDIHVGQYAIACGRGLGQWIASPTPQGNTAPPAGAGSINTSFPAVSVGIVSAIGRRNGNAIQFDAKTSPVNYGGPLIDIEGRLLGLMVPMGMGGGVLSGVEWYDSGIGFAITHDSILGVLDRLKAGVDIVPGKLGIAVAMNEDGKCVVSAVADPSPALNAGIAKGDRIVALDNRPVGDMADFMRRLSDKAVGDEVSLRLRRVESRERYDVTLKLAAEVDIGEMPEAIPAEVDPGGMDPTEPETP